MIVHIMDPGVYISYVLLNTVHAPCHTMQNAKTRM